MIADRDAYICAFMDVLHLSPDFVDERMTVWDFLRACDYIDEVIKARKGA